MTFVLKNKNNILKKKHLFLTAEEKLKINFMKMGQIISKNANMMREYKTKKNKSLFSRFCRFIRKHVCCMDSYEIDDSGMDDFIDYESREMVCVSEGHYKATNPSLFYFCDFVEPDAGQNESTSEFVSDERVSDVEDSIDLNFNLSEFECECVVDERVSELDDTRLFYFNLSDCVELDESRNESECECFEDENVREKDNWCETIVNELIENIFVERSKRRVTFDECGYIYDI